MRKGSTHVLHQEGITDMRIMAILEAIIFSVFHEKEIPDPTLAKSCNLFSYDEIFNSDKNSWCTISMYNE